MMSPAIALLHQLVQHGPEYRHRLWGAARPRAPPWEMPMLSSVITTLSPNIVISP